MTRKQIEDERDKLFGSAIEGPCLLDKKLMWDTAFNAAMKLMEERRVTPLREALRFIWSEYNSFPNDPSLDSEDKASKALAQVEEWSE